MGSLTVSKQINIDYYDDFDIDIDEDDIIEYLKENKDEIDGILQEVYGEDYETPEMSVKRISVEDDMKYELLIDAYRKYNLNELENLLKIK